MRFRTTISDVLTFTRITRERFLLVQRKKKKGKEKGKEKGKKKEITRASAGKARSLIMFALSVLFGCLSTRTYPPPPTLAFTECIEKVSRKCIIRLTPETMNLICVGDSEGVQIWS